MNADSLVREFANCVAAQSEAINNGDSTMSNKFAKRYVSAFDKLRSLGDEGRNALVVLLCDQRADVRVMAAAYLLRHSEHMASAVLKTEAAGKGRVAFGAAQALQRWKEGTWALDPE